MLCFSSDHQTVHQIVKKPLCVVQFVKLVTQSFAVTVSSNRQQTNQLVILQVSKLVQDIILMKYMNHGTSSVVF